ncbi:hypothetical protein B0H66DRAFT_549607, partial [Apodospora peruviana]
MSLFSRYWFMLLYLLLPSWVLMCGTGGAVTGDDCSGGRGDDLSEVGGVGRRGGSRLGSGLGPAKLCESRGAGWLG